MRLAVDTNILIDWAEGDEDIKGLFESIKQRIPDPVVLVLPTVIGELAHIALQGAKNNNLSNTAKKAIELIGRSTLLSPATVPAGKNCVQEIAMMVRLHGLLPSEEVNDSLILAEASLLGCVILTTRDRHLRDIDREDLTRVLGAFDVTIPVIKSPDSLVRQFPPRRPKQKDAGGLRRQHS